jgi:hypothetical protein
MKNERMSELFAYLNTLANVQSSGYKCNGEISEAIAEIKRELNVGKNVHNRHETSGGNVI